MDRSAEIRCYMRDPDGYLIEVGEATGILNMFTSLLEVSVSCVVTHC